MCCCLYNFMLAPLCRWLSHSMLAWAYRSSDSARSPELALLSVLASAWWPCRPLRKRNECPRSQQRLSWRGKRTKLKKCDGAALLHLSRRDFLPFQASFLSSSTLFCAELFGLISVFVCVKYPYSGSSSKRRRGFRRQ